MADEEKKEKDPTTRSNTEFDSRGMHEKKEPERPEDILRSNTEFDSREAGDDGGEEDESSPAPPDTLRG